MTRLINTTIFRSILVALCMLADETPAYIPKPNTTDQHDHSNTTPSPSMKVTGNHHARRPHSAKRRRHSKSVVDSGATVHCIRDRSLFTHLDTSKSVSLRVADKHVIRAEGVGTCAISLKSSNGEYHTETR